jgi:hypothetical protein
MIFPQLGEKYLDEAHKGIIGRMEASYAQAITHNMSFWSEADLDTRFFVGDQTIYQSLYGNVPGINKRNFTFNRIKRIINMISGNQRKNRKQTIVQAENNADEICADQLSKVLMQIYHKEHVLETISSSFEDALVTGLSFLQIYNDFRNDPISGDIKVNKCDYNSFVVDPFWRLPDMSDCNFIWKRSFLTKREIISLMPSSKDIIVDMYGEDLRDGKFQFMPESYGYAIKNLLTYDEFYYRDYREQLMLIDKKTGEVQEWNGKKDEKLNMFLSTYPEITMIEQTIPTVRLALVANGRCLYDGVNPLGDNYPFIPVMAYFSPQVPYFPYRVQGVVRGLRDAQYLYNRRKIIELDILESQVNSGWKYKEDALVNPQDIFLNGQGKGICLKSEAQMTDAEQIIAPTIQATTIQLSELLGKEMQEIASVSEELLGTAVDDKAGILSIVRQNASITTLQTLFDQLDLSQKILGQRTVEIMQRDYMPGKIKRILGGEEPAPQFYNRNFQKYSAHVEEAVLTTTQKQLQFVQLLNLREVGVPIPDDVLVESCTVTNKQKLTESLAKSAQQKQQMEEQQIQLQMQQIQSQIKLSESRATADEGLGIERLSRVQENEQLAKERSAAAERDHQSATLEMIRALKELDTIDITHLKELITLSHLVTNHEAGLDVTASPALKPTKTPKPAAKPKKPAASIKSSEVK